MLGIFRQEYHSKTTNYMFQSELGVSSLGQVRLVRDKQTGQLYALKIVNQNIGIILKINKDSMANFEAEENIKAEILTQSHLNHKNILKMVEMFEDKENLYLVLEYCAKGSLQQKLRMRGHLREDETFQCFHQIIAALDYLHNQNIIHRDIKPENILIHEDGTLKLSNFGWAIKLQQDQQAEPILCGPTGYMSPEVALRHKHDFKADIWSLGVLTYEMLHGVLPYRGQTPKDMIGSILCAQPISIDSKVSQDLQLLIIAMISKLVTHRPTCKQVYLCKWVRRMMREQNIFNKYENELLKKQQMDKKVEFKTLKNSCIETQPLTSTKKIKSEQASSTQSLKQSYYSTSSCSPLIPMSDQQFDFYTKPPPVAEQVIPVVAPPAFPQQQQQ